MLPLPPELEPVRSVGFQRPEPPDPDFDAKLDRIEFTLTERPDRTSALDEFGPLGIRPTAGACWASKGSPDRLPAIYRRIHGFTHFTRTPSHSPDPG